MSRAKTSTKYYKRNKSNQTKVAHRNKRRSQKKLRRRMKNNNSVRAKRMRGIGSKKRNGGVSVIQEDKIKEVIDYPY